MFIWQGRKNFSMLFLIFTAVMVGMIGVSRYAFCNGLLDQICTYSDSSYTTKATSFGDGDTVYVEVTDTVTTGSPKTISIKNNIIGNEISVEVNEVSKTKYRGSFIVYSGANDDENDKLSLFDGQTATITADLASDGLEGTKTITAAYEGLKDQIWTYNDSSYTTETTSFCDGDTVFIKATDTVTTGSPKTIIVKNNDIGNEISVDLTEDSPTIYKGSFIVYSGINDDTNDKLTLYTGQTATITVNLAGDGAKGTKTINCVLGAYINLSDPSPVKAGVITITLTTSNNVVKAPTPLTLTFSDSSTIEIELTGNIPGDIFTGNFTVDESTPEGAATLSLPENALEDQQGNTGNTILSGKTIIIDITPPPAPINLSLSLSGENINVTWDASSPENDVQQYKVYRSNYPRAESTGNLITTISADGSSSYSWFDTQVGKGRFYYAVPSQDFAGNLSTSNEAFIAIESKAFLSLAFVQSIAKPGNPAKITIGVSQPADIIIRIFNLKGYIVYDWTGHITSEMEWIWTGVNMHGQTVNNGTYICKITAKGADGSVVNRMKILGVLY